MRSDNTEFSVPSRIRPLTDGSVAISYQNGVFKIYDKDLEKAHLDIQRTDLLSIADFAVLGEGTVVLLDLEGALWVFNRRGELLGKPDRRSYAAMVSGRQSTGLALLSTDGDLVIANGPNVLDEKGQLKEARIIPMNNTEGQVLNYLNPRQLAVGFEGGLIRLVDIQTQSTVDFYSGNAIPLALAAGEGGNALSGLMVANGDKSLHQWSWRHYQYPEFIPQGYAFEKEKSVTNREYSLLKKEGKFELTSTGIVGGKIIFPISKQADPIFDVGQLIFRDTLGFEGLVLEGLTNAPLGIPESSSTRLKNLDDELIYEYQRLENELINNILISENRQHVMVITRVGNRGTEMARIYPLPAYINQFSKSLNQ